VAAGGSRWQPVAAFHLLRCGVLLRKTPHTHLLTHLILVAVDQAGPFAGTWRGTWHEPTQTAMNPSPTGRDFSTLLTQNKCLTSKIKYSQNTSKIAYLIADVTT
jgi:hypothetical protein